MEESDQDAAEALRKRMEETRRAQENERQIRAALLQILEPTAYDRLTNVRLSNADLYARVVNALFHIHKKTGKRITERELLNLLSMATEKREGSLEIRRK